jgi:hypothetical protein
MTIDQMNREITELRAAVKTLDIPEINNGVQYYYGWMDEVKRPETTDDNGAQEAQRRYNEECAEYSTLADCAIVALNDFVRAEIAGIKPDEAQSTFVSVVQTLVGRRDLRLSLADGQRLRKALLEFIACASNRNEDTFLKVVRLLHAPDPSVDVPDSRQADQAPLLFGQNLMDSGFLPRLIKESYGKNYGALRDLSMARLADAFDTKPVCAIQQERCDRFIPRTCTYFIAFPFSRQDLEDRIVKACDDKFKPAKGTIARRVFGNRTALCQICQMILSSRFGIYVLTKHSKVRTNKYLPNPNVMLELGLAMGNKKPTVMLVEHGVDIPADVQGYLRIPFDGPENLPEIIHGWKFEEFCMEANR